MSGTKKIAKTCFQCINEDDVDSLTLRLEQVPSEATTTKDSSKLTPLHAAASRVTDRAAALCQVLLQHGADPNAQTISGMTPLRLGAWRGNLNVCKALVTGGANVDIGDKGGETPLISAISAGTVVGEGLNMREVPDDDMKTLQRVLIVELLLEHKCNIKAKTLDGESAMCRAIRQGREKSIFVEVLLHAGMQPSDGVCFVKKVPEVPSWVNSLVGKPRPDVQSLMAQEAARVAKKAELEAKLKALKEAASASSSSESDD